MVDARRQYNSVIDFVEKHAFKLHRVEIESNTLKIVWKCRHF